MANQEQTDVFGDELPSDEQLAGPAEEAVTEPEAVQQPEAPAEPEVQAEAEQKTVPLAALHEERQRRKEMAEQLKAQESKFSTLESRLAELNDRLTRPNPDEDPDGFEKWQNEQQQAEQQKKDAAITETREELAALKTQLGMKETEATFAAQHSEYNEAKSHLISSMAKRYVELGFDEAEANQYASGELQQIWATAESRGKDPAAAILAQANIFGFSRSQESKKENAEKLKKVSEGQASSTTLAGQSQSSGELTLDQIANMDDAEWAKTMNDDLLARFFGEKNPYG